jgi:hypothetical protein
MKLEDFKSGMRVVGSIPNTTKKFSGRVGTSTDCTTKRVNVIVRFDDGRIGVITENNAALFQIELLN